jgi:hypothetical protein
MDEIKITMEDSSFLQSLDYWREPFYCHSCWKTCYLKVNYPTVVRSPADSTKVDDLNRDTYIFPHSGTGVDIPFNRDSFLGKMKTCFPSFFNSLSKDDKISLITHED